MKSYCGFAAFLACVAIGASLDAAAQKVRPDAVPWDAGAGFSFEGKPDKVEGIRKSISGIACPTGAGERACLFVFDEGVEARFGVLRDSAVSPQAERVVLLDAGKELDAEGAATDGTYFYVTGSHSTKRKTCAPNEVSRHVIRFQADAKTGRALRDAQGKLSGYQNSGRLWEILSAHEMFNPYVGKCLGTQPPDNNPTANGESGVNIEGLAVKDGMLIFGFRGPAVGGAAPILSVPTDAFFSDAKVDSAALRLIVGEGRGIRDMVAVKDGVLVLAGPDDDARASPPSYAVLFWDGSGAPGSTKIAKLLGNLDLDGVVRRTCDDKEIKPEALTLLSESPSYYRVLVLSDGLCDGGALSFTLAR